MNARDHELADLAVGDRLAGRGVQTLGEEVVLGDVHAAAALALAGHARAHDLGEPVVVRGPDRQPALDLRAHLLAAGLGAEQAEPQTQRLERHAALLQDLADVERVGRRGDQHGGAEVFHELDLAGGVAGADGQHRRAGALQPVVQAEPAGEHAVAEGDLSDVAVVDAGGDGEPAHQLSPRLEIRLGVPAHHSLAGGARRGVDLNDLVHGYGEEAVGIVVAEVRLLGERQAGDAVQAGEVAGLEADSVQLLAVERDALVDPGQHVADARELQLLEPLAVEGLVLRVPDGHGPSLRRCRCRGQSYRGRRRARGGLFIPPRGTIV